MLYEIFKRFVNESPVTVMVGGLLERVLHSESLDALFDRTAEYQYTRELLFSSVFEMMSQVVCGIQPSVHAAYQASAPELSVSITSVYNKLNGIEPPTSEALVHYSADSLAPIIDHMESARPALLAGYRLKVVDGNCLASTQHRLKELRPLSSGALPGKALVVYDPALQMALETVCCEDGHAQERSLLDRLFPSIKAGDAWLADRNFCTRDFLCGIESKSAYFVIRHHQKLIVEEVTPLCQQGRIDTGVLYEQRVRIYDAQGVAHLWRRVVLCLDEPTRDGETEIVVLTNLPKETVSAQKIAQLYQKRWTIERAFQELAEQLNGEINTLGHPPAALFAFCIALVAYNIFAVVKATLRHVHGDEKIEQKVSGYYLAHEIRNTSRGMMIAIPAQQWEIFRQWTIPQVAELLVYIAEKIKLKRYKKHPRGPKKNDQNDKRIKQNRMFQQRRFSLNETMKCYLERAEAIVSG